LYHTSKFTLQTAQGDYPTFLAKKKLLSCTAVALQLRIINIIYCRHVALFLRSQ